MKNKVTIILITIIITLNFAFAVVAAAQSLAPGSEDMTPAEMKDPGRYGGGQTITREEALRGLDTTFEEPTKTSATTNSTSSIIPKVETPKEITGPNKLELVRNLPGAKDMSLTWQGALGNIGKLLLGISGTITFTGLVYGGILMVTAEGDDSKIKKGRGLITWSLIALIIISSAYAVVLGIAQLKFFQ